MGNLVKAVEVYPSVVSSGLNVDFPKMLTSPETLCALSLPVKETTDSGLKCLVGLMVKCSCLQVPDYSSTTM